MPARSRAAGALEDELPAHEFAIILADRAACRSKARVGSESAQGPLPHIAEHAAAGSRNHGARLVELIAQHRIRRGREILPLRFGRKPPARPAGVCVGLEVAYVRDRCRPVDVAPSGEGELAVFGAPIARRSDGFPLDPVPAVGEPEGRGAVAAVTNEFAPFRVGGPAVRDFVAGMTDRYAVNLYEQLFIPKPWAIGG